jgi:FixJ family two-component response regulator
MNPRTIHIVDDNAEFRASARWWLESAGYRVVDHGDPLAALDAIAGTPAAGTARCVQLDVRMPALSGLDFHDRLRERGVSVPVIYMSGHGDVPLAVQAMQKGAVSFLEKPFADDALEQALLRAFDGTAAAATPAPEADAGDQAARQWQERLARLSPRERELLDWVVQDKLNKTIAELMGISIKTVELHRKRMMDKLQAHSATHLVRMAVSGRVS